MMMDLASLWKDVDSSPTKNIWKEIYTGVNKNFYLKKNLINELDLIHILKNWQKNGQ